MKRASLFLCYLVFSSLCLGTDADILAHRKAQAERYFRAIYSCQLSVIDELAAENITISYPIFQQIFGEAAIHGREAAKAFSMHFCAKWTDAQITIEQAIAEQDTVVLVWKFSARDTADQTSDRQSWGGITVLRFDNHGKISSEIGEESAPGPSGRLTKAAEKTSD